MSGFDRDGASQSRVGRSKDLAHAALAQLAFDAIWSQRRPRSQSSESRVIPQVGSILERGAVEKFAASLLHQKRFHFATHLRMGFLQQRGALLSADLASRVVQLFDLLKTLRIHILRVDGFSSVWRNSRSNQALANCQSRLTVRVEIFRAETISSSVRPPK